MSDVPMVSEDTAVESVEKKKAPEKPRKPEMSVGLKDMHANAGSVKLTAKERNQLFAKINEEDVEIRPDTKGIVYLPWMGYAERLRDVFGLEWALIPESEQPNIQTRQETNRTGQPRTVSRIVWGFWLYIRSTPMAFAWGEHVYYSDSDMGYTDSCESAKSEALRRCCKQIGIGLELWKPSFIREWKAKYAYKDQSGKWRRRETVDLSALKDSCRKELNKWRKMPNANEKTIRDMEDVLIDPAATAEGLSNMLKAIRKHMTDENGETTEDVIRSDNLPGPDDDVDTGLF